MKPNYPLTEEPSVTQQQLCKSVACSTGNNVGCIVASPGRPREARAWNEIYWGEWGNPPLGCP